MSHKKNVFENIIKINKMRLFKGITLAELCFDGLSVRYDGTVSKPRHRLEHELNVVNRLGLAGYFLMVHDLVRYARRNNIAVGLGKGALAGCLFSYCLGLTDVDPTEHGLLFERLLNTLRTEESSSYMSVVMDVEIGGCKKLHDYVTERYGKRMPALRKSREICISESRELSVIKDTVRLIKERFGTEINIEDVDVKDDSVYELIRSDETEGIPYFQEDDIRAFVQRQKPQCLEDLMIALALIRPGLEEMTEEYLQNRIHGDSLMSEIPELRPILETTSGCVVFQEQIMEILHKLGGFTLEQSDLCRRNMAKNNVASIRNDRKNFIRGNHEKTAKELFKKINRSAASTFNKSHAVACALMTYRMAWLKKYYGQEFNEATAMNIGKVPVEWKCRQGVSEWKKHLKKS